MCIFVLLCDILLPSGVINDDDDDDRPRFCIIWRCKKAKIYFALQCGNREAITLYAEGNRPTACVNYVAALFILERNVQQDS